MNKINSLFDPLSIKKFFGRKLLPLYPKYDRIGNIEIIPHKKNIWQKTYHVVVEFKTELMNKKGEVVYLPIFCTAHSSEPRENVFTSLKYLWDAGFYDDELSIPRPLFYSKYYNGTFYRGVEGANLYQYIRVNNRKEVDRIIPQAAFWFAKLHALPTDKAPNFNVENSRIETVYPGIPHILEKIRLDYPQYAEFYKQAYEIFDKKEKEFLASTERRWLVHGDAHPENIIKMSDRKIGVIDFTDLCLTDFARDLGAFLQQIEFMCDRKINDPEYTERVKKLFLDSYLERTGIKIDEELQKRIDNYYYWTAMRTSTFFLIKHDVEPERAAPIIERVKQGMAI